MDIYDKAIAFFRDNPSKVTEVWDDPKSHWSGVLFQSATPSGHGETNELGEYCGDLCEIRSLFAVAWTDEVTEQIVKDIRIPKIYASNNNAPVISADLLSIYAEWQRKFDLCYSRDPEKFQLDCLKDEE